jgi:hypothetical protein
MPNFEPGCYFDSHRGIYIGEAVQDLAAENGWTSEPLSADHEFYCEAWEEAEAFMNDNFPVDGHYWGSNDGSCDWGLWECEPDEGE